MSRKIGKFSREELAFVKQNCTKMTYDEMAEILNRTPKAIQEAAEQKLGMNLDSKSSILYHAKKDIRNRAYWGELEAQFSKEELKLFVYHWGLIYDQFKEDITHTEELQIVEVIKIQILAGRILTQQKITMDTIQNLRNQIEAERKLENPNIQNVIDWERQLAGLFAAHSNMNKEYADMSKEKQVLFKALKSTREQRTKNIEDSKESIVAWFRNAVDDRELRVSMGLEMEKMRLAAEKEYQRLTAYHTYVDGVIDRPILTAESVTSP